MQKAHRIQGVNICGAAASVKLVNPESAVANDKVNYIRLTDPRNLRLLELIRGIASGSKPESCCKASMMAATEKHGKHERLSVFAGLAIVA